MVGVNESVSRTKAEKLAADITQSHMPDRTMTSEEREHYRLRKHIIDEGEKGNWKPLYDARRRGLFDQEEVRRIRHDVQLGPLAAATPEEKRQLDPIRLRKRADLLKKGKRSDVVTEEAQ